jgi:uncharacterized protein YqeY
VETESGSTRVGSGTTTGIGGTGIGADREPLRLRLRAAIGPGMKAGDRVTVAALRSALAAIENAEAVDRGEAADRGLAIGQIPVGAGAAEAERRLLTEADTERIVRVEIDEREAAARGYDAAGQPERAARLRAEALVLATLLAGSGAA